MVSSLTISGDAREIKKIFNEYKDQINTLNSGGWEGKSKDNAVNQMSNFVANYEGTINSQLLDYEEAVDKYNSYKRAKEAKELAERNRNREIENARAYNRPANTDYYDEEINRNDEKMRKLQPEINSLLSNIKSSKINTEASALEPGTFSLGDFVNYYQGDYSNVKYGSGSIASCGCGPTSMAMVLTYLTGETVDPPATASYAANNGHYVWGQGTAWTFFGAISKKYGVECEQSSPSSSKVVDALSNGKVIIMSMKRGDFTKNGHFIVLRGITSDGKIQVADPNSRERSSQTWDVNRIVNQSAQMWTFTGDSLSDFVI